LQACFSVTPAAAALLSLDPSVAQPPLPLQEFLPAQACFSTFAFLVVVAEPVSCGAAFTRVMVPLSKPVRAAVNSAEFFEIFISFPFKNGESAVGNERLLPRRLFRRQN